MIKNIYKNLKFIAEIGINHNGSILLAKKLIQQSKRIGCNYVKFQVRNINEIYHKKFLKNPSNAENAHQYIFNEIKKTSLSKKNFLKLFKFSKKQNLNVMVTPFDLKSLKICSNKNVDAIKIGSPDFENIQLISEALKYKKPLFLSTGVSNTDEIKKVKVILKKKNNFNVPITIFHCVSSYPPNEQEINLKYLTKLKKLFPNYNLGYSGHERGYIPSLISIYFGARTIERHITLDRKLPGPDHNSSLTESQFKALVDEANKVIKYLDQKNISLNKFLQYFKFTKNKACIGKISKDISLNSQFNKRILGKSAVYAHNFKKNRIIDLSDLKFLSPGIGISGVEFNSLKNKKLKRNVNKLDYISKDDFKNKNEIKFRANKFKSINRKWGLIGRLGDFDQFINDKSDLIEIHLTWRELLNPRKITKYYNSELIIHAPEYFNDKLIDFTSSDRKVLNNSFEMIENLRTLVENIKNKFYFDEKKGPKVVLHPGGHSERSFVNNRLTKYRNLFKNLKKIRSKDYNLILENMPPFPWYFGGKYYQHIFSNTEEIKKFCEESDMKICFDTSHAKLASNALNKDFRIFTKKILNHIEYLHISDAAKSYEEGLQIGEGEIDFRDFFTIIKNIDASFVPEIWNGHLEKGKGFKLAMERINQLYRKVSIKKTCMSNNPFRKL